MAYAKEYYELHKKEIREQQREHRATSTVWKESNERWKQNNPEKMRLYKQTYNDSIKGKLTKLRLRAKSARIPFAIDLVEFVRWYKEQEPNCYYCGKVLYMGRGQKKLDGYSFDRKDNDKGYTLDNIVLCCNRCNMAKGSWFTEEQMLEIAHKYFNMEAKHKINSSCYRYCGGYDPNSKICKDCEPRKRAELKARA